MPQPPPQQYAAHTPPIPTPQPAPSSSTNANNAIHALQTRISGLEGLLGRGDINDEQRARGQAELEAARANLQRVIQTFLAQQRAAASGPGAPQQRTASPSQFTQPSLAHPPPRAAASPPLEKKLTKKELDKIALDQQRQQQAALVAAQQAAQAKKVAAPPTQYAPAPPPPPTIPQTLSMPKPEPESFPAPRPTLSQGMASAPVVASPAITQHPGLGPQVVQDALGRSVPGKDVVRKDLRPDSTGRTVSKRKLRDLVESVDPEERLSDDVEEARLPFSRTGWLRATHASIHSAHALDRGRVHRLDHEVRVSARQAPQVGPPRGQGPRPAPRSQLRYQECVVRSGFSRACC